MKIFYPFPIIVLFFIATAPVWSDEPKALYDLKKIAASETPVANEKIQQLYKAIESGDFENTKRLQIGIDINFQDRNGITPLYLSVFHNQSKLVSYYLLNNADINLADNDGLAPLHVAGLENLPEMVRLLLDNGAELNATDREGYTPLHIAIDQNSFNAADELLVAGADVNSRAEWQHTPLHTSVSTGNIQMVEKILIELSLIHI